MIMKYYSTIFVLIFVSFIARSESINFNDLSINQNKKNTEKFQHISSQINNQAIQKIISSNEFSIYNFPINSSENSTIKFKKYNSIFKSYSKFYIGNSEVAIPESYFYRGYIENKENSKVFVSIVNNIISIISEYKDESTYFFPSPSDNSIYNLYHSSDNNILGIINGYDYPEDYQFLINLKSKVDEKEKLLSKDLLELDLAYEADSEVFKACGGDIKKTEAYLITMLSRVSSLFEEFIDVRINISWLKIWTNDPNDPYNAKGDYAILRDKALPYWDQNYQDVQRDLFHVSTSISYGGGGYGYLDVLCKNKYYGMAVTSIQCGNDLNSFNFSYDIYITAHEIGHNFNAQHTHSCYWNNAPLDTCVVDNACIPEGTKAKPNPGSIMSYCGGTNNAAGLGYQVRMIYRPENVQIMRTTAENADCLRKVEEPFIQLISPIGKENFEASKAIPIKWKSYNIENIDIYYSANSGIDWILIEKNINANEQIYEWSVGEICSNKMRIKIVNSYQNDIESSSDDDFIIKIIDPEKLIAYYPFDGNSNDEQFCHFYNAENINNVIYTKDRNGENEKCAEFSGNNYLKVDNFDSIYDELTISFWINLSSLDGNQHILGTDWQAGWSFSVYYWGQFGVSFYHIGKQSPDQLWAGSLEKNRWYHIAITYNNQNAKIYIDGVLKANQDWNNAPKLSKFSNTPFYFGARNGKEYFSGKLDEVKLYSRVLSIEEIEKSTNIEENYYQVKNYIYPNPANDYIFIGDYDIEIPYEIYTLEGILIDKSFTNGKIFLPKINSGVYILKYNNNIAKFIKL